MQAIFNNDNISKRYDKVCPFQFTDIYSHCSQMTETDSECWTNDGGRSRHIWPWCNRVTTSTAGRSDDIPSEPEKNGRIVGIQRTIKEKGT